MNLMLTYWNPSEQGVRESQRVVELMKEAKNLRRFRLDFAPSFHLKAVTPAQWDILGMLKTAVCEGGIFTWRIYGAKTYEWEAMPEQVQVYLGRENAVTA